MKKLVFFGTPQYVLPVAKALKRSYRIAGVVTQKPKPSGRGNKLTYSAVDKWAHDKKIPVYYSSHNIIADNISANFAVLASYGTILPNEVINYFPKGVLNIHPSLLPKWRGASPVPAALVSGDVVAGSTIIRLDEKMDHGPILGQFREEIMSNDTSGSLLARLFDKSTDYLLGLLPSYLKDKLKPTQQDHSRATYTRLMKRSDGFVPWKEIVLATKERSAHVSKQNWKMAFIDNFSTHYSPSTIHRFIRAMSPWPGVWTTIKVGDKEKRLKILEAELVKGKLILTVVQLEGKKTVPWEQFLSAYPNVILE